MGLAAASVHAVSDPSENGSSPCSNSSTDENGTDGPVHSGALSTRRHNFEVAQKVAHRSVWCDGVVFPESWCDSVVFLDCSARARGMPLVFLDCSAKERGDGKTGANSVLSSVISPQSTSGQKMPQNFPAGGSNDPIPLVVALDALDEVFDTPPSTSLQCKPWNSDTSVATLDTCILP